MKRIMAYGVMVCFLMFLSACSMVSWDIPVDTDGTYSVDASGAVLYFDDPALISALEIHVPEDAYDTSLDFTLSIEPFNPPALPQMFEPITPLIVVDNGHTYSSVPLEVVIPIEINKDLELAMAFFYDDVTDAYEAIPTKSLSNSELVIFTHHFSKIVVSKILYETVRTDMIQNPWSYITGFEPGVDDWPFNNYGSEIALGGHCAGQTITMMWYYTEKKVKEQQPSLHDLYDNDTPDFWYDDVYAYKFASVIQNKIQFESEERLYYFQTLQQPDIERFYTFAYAIKITQRPQYIGIYTLGTDNKIKGGHAMSVYKIEYYVNEFRLYVVDPNFSGDDQRYIPFNLEQGFGVYGSGANAQDLTEDNLTVYTEFAFYAESAIIDYDVIAESYQKMLDGTIGEDLFASYTYEYLSSDKDGVQTWSPMPDELTYQDIQSSTYAENEILIRTKSKYRDTAIRYFHDYESLGSSIQVERNGSQVYAFTLSEGENTLGIYAQSMIEKTIGNQTYYSLSFSGFKDFKVTFTKKTVEDLETYALGQYYEVERGNQTTSPEYEINLYDDGVFHMIGRDLLDSYKKGDWYVIEGDEEDVLILYSAGYAINQRYVIDTSDDTITLTRDENDYIVYQKQLTKTDNFLITYATSFVEPNYVESPITPIINLDHEWAVDINEPDGMSHQVKFYFHSNFFMRIRVTNTSTDDILYMTFSETPWFIHQHFYYTIADDETIPLTFEIMAYVDDAWTVVYTTSVVVSADFTVYD